MDEELASLLKNKTWKLVRKLENKKIVDCKGFFKIKESIPGVKLRRLKTRLVATGFTQREGLDFSEVFSSVVRHASIRIILVLVVQDLYLEQIDVEISFSFFFCMVNYKKKLWCNSLRDEKFLENKIMFFH